MNSKIIIIPIIFVAVIGIFVVISPSEESDTLSAKTPIESLPKILEKPIIDRSKALSFRDNPTFKPCAAMCVIVVNIAKKIQN